MNFCTLITYRNFCCCLAWSFALLLAFLHNRKGFKFSEQCEFFGSQMVVLEGYTVASKIAIYPFIGFVWLISCTPTLTPKTPGICGYHQHVIRFLNEFTVQTSVPLQVQWPAWASGQAPSLEEWQWAGHHLRSMVGLPVMHDAHSMTGDCLKRLLVCFGRIIF